MKIARSMIVYPMPMEMRTYRDHVGNRHLKVAWQREGTAQKKGGSIREAVAS